MMINLTTTTKLDVNAGFAAERASQIASAYAARDANQAAQVEAAARFDARLSDGKLTPIGNDRFRVNDPGSFDDGEVLFLRKPTFSEVPLILPVTGLDVAEDGSRELLYTARPTWHAAEGVGLVPGGTTDIETVLDLGGINWTVEQSPEQYFAGGEFRGDPNILVNYRSDTYARLGTVTKRYHPVQAREQLAFLQDIAERYDYPFESAGPLNGGKQVFVSMKVPEGLAIDPDGINVHAEYFFAAINDNTGNGAFDVVRTPWIPICGNTNRFALRDAVARTKIRHTESATERIAEAQRQLGILSKYAKAYTAEETALAQTAVTIDQVDAFLADLFPEPKPAKGQSKVSVRTALAHARQTDKLFELWGIESGRYGSSAYALENTVTNLLDNEKNRNAGRDASPLARQGARGVAALMGTDDDLKTRTHKQLLTLTNR